MSTVWLTAVGAPVALTVEDPELRATVEALTVDLAGSRSDAGAACVRVSGTGSWSVRSPGWSGEATTIEDALSQTLTAVNLTAVAATPHLALHCSVVARGDDAVVLAAPSGTGKTTLTAALLQRGWDYVSDESLVLPWDGGPPVTYPRALALSTWSADQLAVGGTPGRDEVFVRPVELGARVRAGGFVIRHVVTLVRDGARPGLAAEQRADALQSLWRRGFTHHHRPGRALELLSAVVRSSDCWRLDLGPPSRQAELLDGLR